MTPERWRIVKEVFEAALLHDEAQRRAYLDRACTGDQSLRADVDAMLASDQGAGSFLEAPVLDLTPELVGEETAVSLIGSQIGHYRIQSLIGAGGMGDVYLAEDIRLGRKVALKVLAPAFVGNAASHARLVREARLASALDHPNICTIYDVGAVGVGSFISMQYVEGDTLQHVVCERPLSVERLLSIALQVADALAAAHMRAIVHRDIKSSNIMLTPRGQVKVLDFGIAKSLEPTVDTASGSRLTRSGAIFGTASYVSPEQARGESVDQRSDIFSFGTVLYEMATGQVPFSRRSAAETMHAVINEPHVPVSEINDKIPSPLVSIIDRTLAKDPSKRYQSIDEIRLELRQIAQSVGLVGSNVAEGGLDEAIPPGAAVHGRRVAPGLWPQRMQRGWGPVGLAVVVVVLIGAISVALLRPNTANSINSIAVLPFGYESSAADLDYLVDGIGESVTGRLSQLSQLRVIARSTMFTYRGRNVDPRAVGRELGVEAVLVGQVRQHDNTVMVRLELVDVHDGARLWGEAYSRPLSELFALPGDLALAVSRELRVHVAGQDERRLTRDYTRSADAYQLYLKGRFFWNKRTLDACSKAIEYFESAIEGDPTFALAYSGLADAHLILRGYGMRSFEKTIPQAKAAAEYALKIDDSIAEAHTSLAWARTNLQDWVGAEASFRRAIELNANYATAYHWHAMYLAQVGRLDEAISAIHQAQALDPLSLIINTEVGRVLFFRREYDAAIAQYFRTLEMDPNFGLAHLHLGSVLVEKRMYTEAIAEFQKASVGGFAPVAGLGWAYAIAGRKREAEEVLERVIRESTHTFPPPAALATLYTGLGDYERAIAWLKRGVNQGGPLFLKVDPRWDRLRSNPEFQLLTKRIGVGA